MAERNAQAHASNPDRTERTAANSDASTATPRSEMKLSQSRDLVAVFDDVEMWSDLDDASVANKVRIASLTLLGAGSLVAGFAAAYAAIGA